LSSNHNISNEFAFQLAFSANEKPLSERNITCQRVFSRSKPVAVHAIPFNDIAAINASQLENRREQ
jgi:hypothetical protein